MEPGGQVAVVGAGAMGAGIARVAAVGGCRVTLVDTVDGAARTAVERIGTGLRRMADRGTLTSGEAQDAAARVAAVDEVRRLPECGLVIEAVPEDLELKQQVFRQLAQTQPATTLFATNTSSLDIDAIAREVPDPERVLGLHFFNPPTRMRLVEVVHGELTAGPYLEHACQLMVDWGRTPVRCASTPGFIVNRVARPFYGEAQRMLEAGLADAATIDACLRSAGFPMGPLELTDLIGQDVNLAVGTSVWEQTGRDERYAPTALQQRLVEQGRLGRKSGHGVYRYAGDGRPLDAPPDEQRVSELLAGSVAVNPLTRTVAMLVNEAVDLVRRGEATEQDVDLAMTLGTGYPLGPVAWGREIGFDVVAEQLAELDEAFPGGRYRPSPALSGGLP